MQSLSIRHWRYSEIKEVIREINTLLESAKIRTSIQGYQTLFRKENKEIFFLLEKICFFQFHRTNVKKQVCYIHQVIKYMASGYHLYISGKFADRGEIEVHHLNHNITDNSAKNLVYVSPMENKLLSHIIGGHNYSIVNHPSIRKDFYGLVLATIKRTFENLALSSSSILPQLQEYVTNLPGYLDQALKIIANTREEAKQVKVAV